jgi:ATP-dependent DNA ligase
VFFGFIHPCHPQRANKVPAGEDWQHEIKFDGFRVQIHKLGREVEIYSRNGHRFGKRYPQMADAFRGLPAKSAIIDGELVASDAAGMPDFWRLFLRSPEPAQPRIWAFDLLAHNGKDLRKWSQGARQIAGPYRRQRPKSVSFPASNLRALPFQNPCATVQARWPRYHSDGTV